MDRYKIISISDSYFHQKITNKYKKGKTNLFGFPLMTFNVTGQISFKKIDTSLLFNLHFYNKNISSYVKALISCTVSMTSGLSKLMQSVVPVVNFISFPQVSYNNSLQNSLLNHIFIRHINEKVFKSFSSEKLGNFTHKYFLSEDNQIIFHYSYPSLNKYSNIINKYRIDSILNDKPTMLLSQLNRTNIKKESYQGNEISFYEESQKSKILKKDSMKNYFYTIATRNTKRDILNNIFQSTPDRIAHQISLLRNCFYKTSPYNIYSRNYFIPLLSRKFFQTYVNKNLNFIKFKNEETVHQSLLQDYPKKIFSHHTVTKENSRNIFLRHQSNIHIKNRDDNFYFQNQRHIEKEIEKIHKMVTETKKALEEKINISHSASVAPNVKHQVNINYLTHQVYQNMERQIRMEKERRGL